MDSNLGSTEMLQEKWSPVINHTDLPSIEVPRPPRVSRWSASRISAGGLWGPPLHDPEQYSRTDIPGSAYIR